MALKIEEGFLWRTCSWPPINDRFLSCRRHPRSRCVVQDEVQVGIRPTFLKRPWVWIGMPDEGRRELRRSRRSSASRPAHLLRSVTNLGRPAQAIYICNWRSAWVARGRWWLARRPGVGTDQPVHRPTAP